MDFLEYDPDIYPGVRLELDISVEVNICCVK